MTMKDFYTKYNINTFEFAGVIGVGQRSLKKYENGEPLRESTKTRIEKAVKIIINNDLHRPKAPIGSSWLSNWLYEKQKWDEKVASLLAKEL